jgi:uncharacterized protein involved in exopolysaccharide biosynthesis
MTASTPFVSPRDVARALFRHKWKAATFFCLAVAATMSVILWYPRKYRSHAELFVRVGRESVTLDPTATTGPTVSMVGTREFEINSVVQMIQNRAMIEKVVDQLSPAVVLNVDPGKPETASAPSVLPAAVSNVFSSANERFANLDPLDDRERAVQRITKSLGVYTPKDSTVVTLEYSDESPQQAQRIVACLLEAYMAEHARINRITGSHEFFDDQSKLMHTQWQSSVEELRDLKNDLGLVSIETQRNLLEEQQSRLDEQLVLATSARAASEAKAAELKKLVEELPVRKVTSEEAGYPNVALDGMRQQLYELEVRERELLSKFTDAHPQIVALRGQVKEARAILADQEKDRSQVTTAVNPAREKLDLNLKIEQAEIQALTARVTALQGEISRIREKVERLNENEVRMVSLEQQAEVAHRNYLAHAEKLEQARVNDALESQRISNVNVIQPASLEPKPISPRKGIVAAMGLAVATLGSLLIALVCELTDRSLRTPVEVEQELGLPVLAALPRVSGHRPSVNQI